MRIESSVLTWQLGGWWRLTPGAYLVMRNKARRQGLKRECEHFVLKMVS